MKKTIISIIVLIIVIALLVWLAGPQTANDTPTIDEPQDVPVVVEPTTPAQEDVIIPQIIDNRIPVEEGNDLEPQPIDSETPINDEGLSGSNTGR